MEEQEIERRSSKTPEEGAQQSHSGTENLKKSRPKKLVKSNKSISLISKMAKNQFLNWDKV